MTSVSFSYKFFFFICFIHCIPLSKSSRLLKNINDVKIFDVLNFGAIGDGQKDGSKVFKDVWEAACSSSVSSPIFLVPPGKKFLLQPLTFNGGDCKSKDFTFQIDGNIIAPSNPSSWKCKGKKCKKWINFDHFDGLLIQGSGTINSQGTQWWNLSCKSNKKLCRRKATGFSISHSKNVKISGLTFEDSPKTHIAFERSTSIHATRLQITAPGNSPNTNGIHIQRSTKVSIDYSIIQTGDDCISIGDGSKHINISKIECGPGHGISIGSLGIKGKTEKVEFVHVRDVTFNRTTNGVRIKTWQGGHGYARNIRFERIISHYSTRPIIIDQYYCPYQHCKNKTSAVEVSNVAYNQIGGTSHKEVAVELSCSESIPCKNITMKDIYLIHEEEDENASSYCLNVQGFRNGRVHPNVDCLRHDENL